MNNITGAQVLPSHTRVPPIRTAAGIELAAMTDFAWGPMVVATSYLLSIVLYQSFLTMIYSGFPSRIILQHRSVGEPSC